MSVKLIESIASGRSNFSELSKGEVDNVISTSVSYSDMRALNSLLNHYTGIYDYDDRKPWWLESHFTDSIWELNFGGDTSKGKRTIEWNAIVLDDNQNITSPTHTPLLNAFKYWITATDNPHENGGVINKIATVRYKLNTVIALINAILLHSEAINLSTQHLSALSKDYLLAILVRIASDGQLEGVYNFSKRFKELILKNIPFITDKQASEFADKYPYTTRTMLPEELSLRLTVEERVKACYWLESTGFYRANSNNAFKPQGCPANIIEVLYKQKIIPTRIRIPSIKELWLTDIQGETEYAAIPNNNRNSEALKIETIDRFLSTLKLLNVVHDKVDVSPFPIDATRYLTISRINEHITLEKEERTRTQSPHFVFRLIEQCYGFIMETQDAILNSTLRVLQEASTKSSLSASNPDYRRPSQKGHIPETPSTELGAWLKSESLSLIDEYLIEIGVNCTYLINDKDRHQQIRNNESLFALYDVLIGSIQTLIGVIMARRQDELIQLKSHGNLSPNISPFSKDGETTDYHLTFKAKKTGSGGKHSKNTTINRPIVRSFARFIWKLEQFNLEIKKHGLGKGKLFLFNKLNFRKMSLSKVNANTYNKHIDAMCDYFETNLVEYENGEIRRNYIREHQLRRFFAMVFFWSKGFDGLESLRWMLGHADLEHLYHYISESETGAILNETKASVLVQGIKDKAKERESIDNIDKLETIIAQRYGIKQKASVLLSTVSDAITDYEDTDDYKTIPHISQLEAEQELEYQILELLNDDVITLEPNFFTVTSENEETINSFTLALEVKELN